jgi:hypothetical protein
VGARLGTSSWVPPATFTRFLGRVVPRLGEAAARDLCALSPILRYRQQCLLLGLVSAHSAYQFVTSGAGRQHIPPGPGNHPVRIAVRRTELLVGYRSTARVRHHGRDAEGEPAGHPMGRPAGHLSGYHSRGETAGHLVSLDRQRLHYPGRRGGMGA